MIKISIQKLQRIPRLLIIIFFTLLLLNLIVIVFRQITGHARILGIIPMFDFDAEKNIPTFFSSLNLLFSSLLLCFIYRSHKKSSRSDSKYWLALSIIFLLLSIDEYVSAHETLIIPLREALGITRGVLYFPWVVPAIVICVILILFFLRFYLGLPRRFKLLFGVSALVYVFGVIGMEMIDGLFFPVESNFTLIYDFLTTIEESLEMLGIILFIYSLLKYMTLDAPTASYEIE